MVWPTASGFPLDKETATYGWLFLWLGRQEAIYCLYDKDSDAAAAISLHRISSVREIYKNLAKTSTNY